ncbi:MAG: hypothetical protein ABJD53_03065 [Gammaproteobacteria bacterium]
MTDAYIYYFTVRDSSTGRDVPSERRATLAAIRGIGVPIMESQIVADISEIDVNGFFADDNSNESTPPSDVANEIRSLQLRADSRDSAALKLNDATEGEDKYMLQLESRELRSQAHKLHNGRNAPISDCKNTPIVAPTCSEFDEILAAR